MPNLTLYHNPRCSKSRAALQLLEERGLQPLIVRYLDTPPSTEQLHDILRKLGINARQLLRSGEAQYKELDLDREDLSESELVEIMVAHPKLIERPILVAAERAVVGRPVEKILELLP